MAKTQTISSSILFFSILILGSVAADHHRPFSETLPPTTLKLKPEKLTHLHFYFHDIVSGPHPSLARIAEAPTSNTSETYFGVLIMIDDPLTVGPERTSKEVGRAQGMYGLASQTELVEAIAITFLFTEGEYNGSSVSVLGRNPPNKAVREMPIVGGSGVFQFASGYVKTSTHAFDPTTGDAIMEYDVYVLHREPYEGLSEPNVTDDMKNSEL